ncbi:MAG TPA: hypothetical protein DD624_07770 [Alphaproteobacteria bacterium]|nr:hypothetical protein [Alphaproteobacteria bacterium]
MKTNSVKKALVVAALTASVAACGSIYEKEPVGIGKDISELKRSPCACMMLKLPANLPDWLMSGAQG